MPASSLPSYRPAPKITELGPAFYDEVVAAAFPEQKLRFRNDRWAARVGLGALTAAEWEAHFARFEPLPANLAKPLALRYHGHQFDVYNPRLGDGRGFLFAQLREGPEPDGRLLDLGTKGSGPTPWSRGGDGRLTLKGGVREVLATEMLEALGVDTSKSFSLFETGESLVRGDEPSPTRSAVLVRLSHSHIRFGTFQRLAFLNDLPGLERLLDYTIQHYYPQVAGRSDRVAEFLRAVTHASATYAASLMVAGFVHGVLNSDNMNVTGECFDYGPYRFLPKYDVDFVAAYFDEGGLYSFGRQPLAVFTNLMRLADSLRLLVPGDALGGVISEFEPALERAMVDKVLARLGVAPRTGRSEATTGLELASAVYAFLETSSVEYDRFFFDWYGGLSREPAVLGGPAKHVYRGAAWETLRACLEGHAPVKSSLPGYFEDAAPCSLLIDEIEAIWARIATRDDWAPFEAKIAAIRRMGDALGVTSAA